ncbi:electron transfer flavoprotein, beta subunit [Trichuris trichiura]|uniref:Electron transfer flavoprotein subunit beta n=1 Tax=Trichuris trichiura TaxID=36087 RepID=A0A077ZB85_TRITR|nr:electron transfer flavoprotein, beta subunit [Trichuris trichiura]
MNLKIIMRNSHYEELHFRKVQAQLDLLILRSWNSTGNSDRLPYSPIEEAMSLRVLVAVKRVIDYAVKVRVKPDKTGVITEGVKHSMNPFDEIAIEEALRLKEKQIAAEVLAVSCGPTASQEVLRHALALGADKAIHVEVEPKQYEVMEPLHVAKALSRIVADEKIDLVILGKQAIDDDSNQTGQMLAALLDWPQALFASKLESDGAGWFKVNREVDSGVEVMRVKLPAIVTTDLRLNEPRYATLPNIMKSKKKPLLKKAISELGVNLQPHQAIMEVNEPRKREMGELVGSVDELMSKLQKAGEMAQVLLSFAALFLLCYYGSVADAQELRNAKILAAKNLLSSYAVEGKELVISYSLYNIGDKAAVDVELKDDNFVESQFRLVRGSSNARWSRIPGSANVSHVLVVVPLEYGSINYTAAKITYRPNEESAVRKLGYTTSRGVDNVYALKDYHRQFEQHYIEWLIFFLMICPSLAAPAILWLRSKKKFSVPHVQKGSKSKAT